MLCGLLLCDKDTCLLQLFVHIQYYMLSYFKKNKYVFSQANKINFAIAITSHREYSFSNCLVKICSNTLKHNLTIVIFVTVGVLLCVRMFLPTVLEKMHAETSVQLGSNILVLSK